MIGVIDRFIENKMKKIFHDRGPRMINKTLLAFQKSHPGLSTEELKVKLLTEAARIFPVVDSSILNALITRAKYTFWITAVTSTLFTVLSGGFSSGVVIRILAPALTSFVAWGISLGTIPVSYINRIKGALNSAVVMHLSSLNANPSVHIHQLLNITPGESHDLNHEEKLDVVIPVNQPAEEQKLSELSHEMDDKMVNVRSPGR
ncbi:MAG: hypothetical protein P4M12_10025 [Gammaproteobacteria bacterium]|nr:hypothetical protein [Gammaproteobacteria bacterium]